MIDGWNRKDHYHHNDQETSEPSVWINESSTYMRGSGSSSLESTEDLQEIILSVSRQRVSPGIDANRRSSGNTVIKPDVSSLRLVELHVPVAVRRNLFV